MICSETRQMAPVSRDFWLGYRRLDDASITCISERSRCYCVDSNQIRLVIWKSSHLTLYSQMPFSLILSISLLLLPSYLHSLPLANQGVGYWDLGRSLLTQYRPKAKYSSWDAHHGRSIPSIRLWLTSNSTCSQHLIYCELFIVYYKWFTL